MTKKLAPDVKMLRALNRAFPKERGCPFPGVSCINCVFNNFGPNRDHIIATYPTYTRCGVGLLMAAQDQILANHSKTI